MIRKQARTSILVASGRFFFLKLANIGLDRLRHLRKARPRIFVADQPRQTAALRDTCAHILD